ncbi:alcohol dehydrogenase catalytic domain-containing protein [Phytohabitans sp. ZYX-F-186]|uniref:Alcohol dehydrogenase catalytic domain-containing protein n=1 Tax=Phytohabitans maris TaxID=3071409 RepID=A0ABU0ZUV7_9ACTN|nr:alcohol dehydrogenase catalytic domain-containing protein [Phytohabitans sp. ZYX-F-186]MDQ7910826.1 alcohol dehydrogenase catalytic domain-containing protein [Phytohabitans sp. ZYX-F-186]
MEIQAAVLYAPPGPLELVTVSLDAPRADEVVVRVAASGLCGSDLHLVDGSLEIPGPHGARRPPLPIIPGHEAAGVVERVGSDVRAVAPGDHVIINIYPGCGRCPTCRSGRPARCAELHQGYLADGTTRFSVDGRAVHHMAYCSSFADAIVVPESGCVKVRADMPLDRACLIGCGVTTGYSAVFNVAKVHPGASVLVVGAGGVGLNVIQSAFLAAATTIIAVDIGAAKLATAELFGATHTVDASAPDWVAQVLSLTGGRGVDFGFEAVSTPVTIRQAFDATANGGQLTIVGLAPPGSEVSYPASITKSVTRGGMAWARPWQDFPRIVELYLAGRFKLDELVTRTRPMSEVNLALRDLRDGVPGRTVLVPA